MLTQNLSNKLKPKKIINKTAIKINSLFLKTMLFFTTFNSAKPIKNITAKTINILIKLKLLISALLKNLS